MKKGLAPVLAFSFILFTNSLFAQAEAFITKWKLNPEQKIAIKTTPSYIYNYDVDWDNDGIYDAVNLTGDAEFQYDSPEDRVIRIKGDFPHITSYVADSNYAYNPEVDINYITEVMQWGDIQWQDINAMFMYCDELSFTATDLPDWSQVEDASRLFRYATSFNEDISEWDMSNILNMEEMFFGAANFNGAIGSWDVSGATNMCYMFASASTFNQPLNDWDVSNVLYLDNMFYKATAFNQDLMNWDISNVERLYHIFEEASSFNGDISSWDVSSVSDLSGMFCSAISFNGDISGWDVSSIEDLNDMFVNAIAFNGDLSLWDVSNVKYMNHMFEGATAFNGDISGWDVANVINMNHMFAGAIAFDRDLSQWNVSNVQDMAYMFEGAKAFKGDIKDWDVSNVYNIAEMFKDMSMSSSNYDDLLINWSELNLQPNLVFNAGNTYYSSEEAKVARQSIIDNYNWTIIDGGIHQEEAFITKWKLDENRKITLQTNEMYTYNYDVDWNNDGVYEDNGITGDISYTYESDEDQVIRIRGDFPHFKSYITDGDDEYNPEEDFNYILEVKQWGSIEWESMRELFQYADMLVISATDAPDLLGVEDMSSMFRHATNFNGDLSKWNVNRITDMTMMFAYASSFNGDLSMWDVANLTYMHFMFQGAEAFNSDISSWDVSSAAYIDCMFDGAISFNADLSSWNVSGISFMYRVFADAKAFNGNISTWDVSNVEDMEEMFSGAIAFNQDLSPWDVSSVTDMTAMFMDAESFEGGINSWDVSKVSSMNLMFKGAKSFDGHISDWKVTSVIDMDAMFLEVAIPTSTYNSLLINWSQLDLQSDLVFDAGQSTYSGKEATEARQSIIDNYNWTILDNGPIGIQEISSSQFKVYPNPSSGTINIDLTSISSNIESVEMMNMHGEKVYHNNSIATPQMQMELSSGIYLLKLETAEGMYSMKVIVR